jgi:protein phosphatase
LPADQFGRDAFGRGVWLEFAALSEAGLVRPHNEDRWRADPEDGVFVLADGMGGYNAGEVAADLAVQTACRLIPELAAQTEVADAMRHALAACNDRIRDHAAGNRDCLGMGTTIVACLVRDGRLHFAHIGDSRAYLLRDGHLRRLTRDHSIGQQIADSGALTEAQVRHLPGRGILTRALGVEASVSSDCATCDWQAQDTLLLCSDGLTDLVPDERIGQLLEAGACAGPHEQAKALVAAAIAAGGSDNVSVVVVRATGPAGQEPMH